MGSWSRETLINPLIGAEEQLSPPQMRTIKHLPVDTDDAGRRIFRKCFDDPCGMGKCRRGRCEGAIDYRDLGRMDGKLAGEAITLRFLTFARRPSSSR